MINIIREALNEDIGKGDITTDSIVSPRAMAKAVIIAKQSCVVSGLDIAKKIFTLLDNNISFKEKVRDGAFVKKGTVIAKISGKAKAILSGERVALNFLQRLCAVATVSKEFSDKVKGTKTLILDTRKTTPLMRALEKMSVKAGGSANHRFGLYDAILIKDNHIVAANGIGNAIKKVKAAGHKKIEAEAKSLLEVQEALSAGADIILLDNMTSPLLKKSVAAVSAFNKRNRRKVKTEASGGINIGNVKAVALTGVDFISVGALTHSAGSIDLSLEMVSITE